MSKYRTIIIIGCIFALLAVFGLISLSTYTGAFDKGNRAEQRIEAEYKELQNIMSNYRLKISEAAQVPKQYKKDLVDVIDAAIGGRYGSGGSKAAFQWIKEHNPTLDSNLYLKIQQMIQAGREEFAAAQKRFLDIKRGYRTELGSFWSGLFLEWAGYPKIEIGYPRGTDDKYKIVISKKAKQIFESGEDEAVKVF